MLPAEVLVIEMLIVLGFVLRVDSDDGDVLKGPADELEIELTDELVVHAAILVLSVQVVSGVTLPISVVVPTVM